MTRVAPVKLQYNPRTLWFDPQDLEVAKDDPVVVKTARGTEFGHMASDCIEVEESELKRLKSSLKPVVRLASEEDVAQAERMRALSDEALPVFREMAAQTNEDMRPVSVEYLFDGDKAVFYFEAEERVDFRDLVRRLASRFRIRVDMRQIGVRDEARMVGGIGHCGQELCCRRLGGDFNPVSIRMAKEQDLSLNPQKISGVCGRLMCCLRYEYEAYKEFKSRAPKQGSMVATPDGPAKVVELDMPKELVSLKTAEGKVVKIPLSEMDPPEEGARPNSVSAEVYEAHANRTVIDALGDQPLITPHFTGTDKLADPKARKVHGNRSGGGRKQRQEPAQGSSSRRPRRRTSVSAEGRSTVTGEQKRAGSGQQPQKKRTQSQGRKKQQQGQAAHAGAPKNRQGQAKQPQRQGSGPRPGQRSSGLRAAEAESRQQNRMSSGAGAHRTARKRSHKAQGGAGEGAQGASGASKDA